MHVPVAADCAPLRCPSIINMLSLQWSLQSQRPCNLGIPAIIISAMISAPHQGMEVRASCGGQHWLNRSAALHSSLTLLTLLYVLEPAAPAAARWVGSCPAGKSAAAHAPLHDPPHVLLPSGLASLWCLMASSVMSALLAVAGTRPGPAGWLHEMLRQAGGSNRGAHTTTTHDVAGSPPRAATWRGGEDARLLSLPPLLARRLWVPACWPACLWRPALQCWRLASATAAVLIQWSTGLAPAAGPHLGCSDHGDLRCSAVGGITA